MKAIGFSGRTLVITGAGGGLGKTYALEIARRRGNVIVNDPGGQPDGTGTSRAAEQVVAEIKASGGTAIASFDSVATPAGGEAIVQSAIDAFGQVDAVIHNAGILRDRSLSKLSDEEIEAVLGVHLLGAFNVARPAFRHMRERGYGRFVFTTSAAGLFGNFGQANYAAAKMGMVGLANVIAVEGEAKGIKANVVSPIAATRLTEELLGPLASALDPAYVTPLVTYLASEECDVTHQIFSAGGGRYARAFVGLAAGWWADGGAPPSADDIGANFAAISSTEGFVIPGSVTDELSLMGRLAEAVKS